MSSDNTNETERSGTASLWSDLHPDFLHSIYAKLPCIVDRADFGSVCKNWRGFYSAANGGGACRVSVSHNADFTVCTFRIFSTLTAYRNRIPDKIRRDFTRASVVGRDETRGGRGWWWLLSNSAGEIFCCFNPLLPSGSGNQIIELPRLSGSDKNGYRIGTRAAFSAPPTDPNSIILAVNGDGGYLSTFSTHLRSQDWWATYRIQVSAWRMFKGVGYNGGKFWCLFDTGEVLMFEFDGDDLNRRKVTLTGPAEWLVQKQINGIGYLRASVKLEGGFEVLSWERAQGVVNDGFRLLTVVAASAAAAEELEEVATLSLKEGGASSRSRRAFLVLDQVLIWRLTEFHPTDWMYHLFYRVQYLDQYLESSY